MVGASNNYIRLPFLRRSVTIGVTGAFVANIILLGIVYAYKKELSGILTPGDIRMVIFIAAIVFVLGFLISVVSTWLALNKFLRLKFDELFY